MPLLDSVVQCINPGVMASNRTLIDCTGRGLHGTMTSTASLGASVCRGVSSNTMLQNQTSDWVTFPSSLSSVLRVDKWSIGFWARLSNPYQIVYSNAFTSGLLIYCSTSGGLGFGFQIGIGGTYPVRSSSELFVANEWCHGGISYSDKDIAFYLNGKNIGTAVATNNPTWGASSYGGWSTSPTETTLGNLGELVLWNRPLSAPEWRELYRQGNGAIGRQLTGQTRRRVYGFVPAAAGARRRRILTGMV